MMRLLVFIALICFATSCSKDKTAVTSTTDTDSTYTTTTPTTPTDNTYTVLYSGTFSGTSGITSSGKAEIIERSGSKFVKLGSDFTVSNGPDLKVYLSKYDAPQSGGFVNLGALTKTSGSSEYSIPSSVDVATYSYVLIHCQQYNHLFAVAKYK